MMPSASDVKKPAKSPFPSNAAIGQLIRTLRVSAGLTLEDAANLSGMSGPYISRLEVGQLNPTVHALQCVAGVYGLSVGQALERAQELENSDGSAQLETADVEVAVWLNQLRGLELSQNFKTLLRLLISQEVGNKTSNEVI